MQSIVIYSLVALLETRVCIDVIRGTPVLNISNAP
jgi:hypothetical protein